MRVLIAFVIVWWITSYCIAPMGAPRVRLSAESRLDYAVAYDKDCLPSVLKLNAGIRQGAIPSDIRVYGWWIEDHRFYCDFTLVGSIYGYGSHLRFEGLNSPREVWEMMRQYDIDYLMWAEERMRRVENYIDFAIPYRHPQWVVYFEPTDLSCLDSGSWVWRVK